jgi:hypothetical protein
MEKYTGYSGHASLAIVGTWMKDNQIWKEIEERVKIKQKVIKHTPTDKMKDLLIHIFSGGHGIADINNRVRTDKSLQLVFGRSTCAEQSTISETLDTSTGENVLEFMEALKVIYQKQGQGYRHEYESKSQVLDIDLSAMVAGKQAEGATKGYFSGHKDRRGRQLGRVVASLYGEIVSEKLYPGTVQLEKNLPELIKMAESVLDLDENRRKSTILRFDAGGGTDANINFFLERDYFGITKVKNWQRTDKLVKSVTSWQSIPQLPDHECGWVSEPHEYVRPTRQLAIRWPNKKKGGWLYCVMVFNLTNELIFELACLPIPETYTESELISVIVDAYDLRGGGVETSYKNSKQGIGLLKRNKKCFHAQEMLVLLAQLAYNITGWVQYELAQHSSTIASFGVLRMIRDAFQIAGKIEFDAKGNIISITLNQIHKLAKAFYDFWQFRFVQSDVSFILGEI